MIWKVMAGIGALFALFLFSGVFTQGITSFRTQTDTQQFTVVTTGATTADVTLSDDLFQAKVTNVDTVTSSDVDDAPVASAYDTATKKLTLTGLATSTTRTITVKYLAESNDQGIRTIGPFLFFIVFGGLIAAIFFGIFHKGRGH